MTSDAALRLVPLSPFEQLRYAREIIEMESQALARVATRLGLEFCDATALLHACCGTVVVTGVGKAGLIGAKISATLASTGTRSIFLNPVDAMHGDLGRVRSDDVALILSQSGETQEVLALLPSLARLGTPIIAVTARATSSLARAATVTLALGPLQEACPLGMAPSTSTTAMLGLGDALALVTMRLNGFGRDEFAQVHPAGALGKRLSRVEEKMRPLAECRVSDDAHTVRQVLASLGRPGRRTGAIMLVDETGALSGVFTDSDLARLFENHRDAAVDAPVRDVMTRNPCRVSIGSMLTDAVAILAERKISELPVIDSCGAPLGLLDITDVLGMLPDDGAIAQ
ncbi:MAG TPA: KpsF/GutQ family sugar-phosphate isomerase [Pirellulales bacterium]|jgi:arabinose-5-phosphate isomerase